MIPSTVYEIVSRALLVWCGLKSFLSMRSIPSGGPNAAGDSTQGDEGDAKKTWLSFWVIFAFFNMATFFADFLDMFIPFCTYLPPLHAFKETKPFSDTTFARYFIPIVRAPIVYTSHSNPRFAHTYLCAFSFFPTRLRIQVRRFDFSRTLQRRRKVLFENRETSRGL